MSQREPDDDLVLFRRAMAGVRPLRHDKPLIVPPQVDPMPRQTRMDDQQVLRDMMSDLSDSLEVETGDELAFQRPGLSHNHWRRLRRGQFVTESVLDLHGMTVLVAKTALVDFLHMCHMRQLRCARIIHGKGHGSKGKQPILKGKLNSWLQQRNDILAFCSSRPADGGTGAVYVLLRRLP